MTLAEVFLLLLFVAWYGVASATTGPGNLKQLELDNQALKRQLASAEAEVNRLREFESRVKFYQEILDALGDYLHTRSPSSVSGLIDQLKKHDFDVTQLAKRGSPMCNPEGNVIGIAHVRDGIASLTLTRDLNQEIPGADGFASGTLQGERLQAFLDSISRFYSARRAAQNDCRYDYRLEWTNDSDYRTGRQQFEQKYFYLAGERRVSEGN